MRFYNAKNINEFVPTAKLKEQVKKYLTMKNTDITWYNSAHTTIERSNIQVINPIKIVITKNLKTYVILSYGPYSNDKNDIFLYDKNNKTSWLKMIELIKNALKKNLCIQTVY